ncbi:MAG TPA: cysteine-rich CWC family protein [Chryseolinea sp.]|nr:cysteine-rich CWC family protein [Chryseolinea sp.]HPM31358.1 cysteine-rich CWC family protein [Chryseolinea sp.]
MSKSLNISKDHTSKHEILACKRCASEFECQVGDIGNCQCSEISLSDASKKFLSNTYFGCLCVNCLTEIERAVSSLEGKSFPKPSEQIENVHYYIENGFYVFTERYHILRGSCCKSGCRHCPYGYLK